MPNQILETKSDLEFTDPAGERGRRFAEIERVRPCRTAVCLTRRKIQSIENIEEIETQIEFRIFSKNSRTPGAESKPLRD
jgi:hypothetical protein